MAAADSVDFFEAQFRRQAEQGEAVLNPFEIVALPHLRGSVLDLGCGIGNLACEAARAGCSVQAFDASPTAIAHLRRRAQAEHLALQATCADLRHQAFDGEYDAVVSIGLLMFFDCAGALQLLRTIQRLVRPGGVAVVNVLVAGTTFTAMFGDAPHCLLAPGELERHFAGWTPLHTQRSEFEAPGATTKVFETVVMRRPARHDRPPATAA